MYHISKNHELDESMSIYEESLFYKDEIKKLYGE